MALFGSALLVLFAVGCAAQKTPRASSVPAPAPAPPKPPPRPTVAAVPDLGIEVVGLHLSGGGSLVDLRYRVVNPSKAKLLTDRQGILHLRDEGTGLALNVPVMPYVGALRQTALEPEAGKVYFILFGNAARSVKAGSLVTLMAGDSQVARLVVA
jgi:hypothetical protein